MNTQINHKEGVFYQPGWTSSRMVDEDTDTSFIGIDEDLIPDLEPDEEGIWQEISFFGRLDQE